MREVQRGRHTELLLLVARRHTEAAVAKHESKDADASWMLAVPAAADASALQGDLLRLLAVFMKIPQVYFLKCCKQHKRICICV